MADKGTGYKHDASDRKLDESAEAANETGPTTDTQHSSGPRHDPAKIRQHDDHTVDDDISDAGSRASAKRKS